MRILAFDAAGKGLSAAIIEDGRVLAEAGLNVGLTHSQRLLPLLQALMQAADIEAESIDMVAVTNGPGSFTGLRIGLSTAKGLAAAWGVPLAAVSTLSAVSYAVRGMGSLICPMLDARRNEVYTALYDADGAEIWEPQAIAPDKLAEKLLELLDGLDDEDAADSVILVGDAAAIYWDMMREKLGDKVRLAPAERRFWGAVGCAFLAAEDPAVAGEAAAAQAFYLRLSEAERNRLERLAKEKAESEKAGSEKSDKNPENKAEN